MDILLADDHPLTIEGYVDALSRMPLDEQLQFTKTYDCRQAFEQIDALDADNPHFALAILDNSMPEFAEQNVRSGVDLAQLIRKKQPDCKIIIITAHNEVIIVYDIVKKARPDGLILKNDVTPDKLQQAVREVLAGETYQSPLVRECIAEIWKKDLMVEDRNRQILFYLSKGFKIKEMEELVHLTASAIQKRISQMRKAFDVHDDNNLVREAVRQGFI